MSIFYTVLILNCFVFLGFRLGQTSANLCKSGFYDSNCQKSCEYCKTGCNTHDGKCLTKECNIGFYGSDCSQKCGHCVDKICNHDNGFCPTTCEENWSGIKCDVDDLACFCNGTGRKCSFKNRFQPLDERHNRVNVALGKEAILSSMVDWDGPEDSIYRKRIGCLAVNGDRGNQLKYFWDDASVANCILTSDADENPTFTLNLGRTYSVINIVIFVRKDYEDSLVDATINVNGQRCYVISVLLFLAYNLQCYSPITGQIITLSRPSNNVLTFCELEVWVCRHGFYGSDCDIECDTCRNGCEAQSGTCLSLDCRTGFYGPNCNMSCENCINGCNSVSGECTTADCKIGFYGSHCRTKCGYCRERECEYHTGACKSGCEEHWLGDKCDQIDLPCTCPTKFRCDFTNVYTDNQVNVAFGRQILLSSMTISSGVRAVHTCFVNDGQRMLHDCVETHRRERNPSITMLLGSKYTISKVVIYSNETVTKTEKVKILWDFEIRTDRVIPARRPDIVVLNKSNRTVTIKGKCKGPVHTGPLHFLFYCLGTKVVGFYIDGAFDDFHDTNRLLQSVITVDGEDCFTIKAVTPFVVNITCNTPLTGEEIHMLRRDSPIPGRDHTLLICEFEVWACRSAFYGRDCEHSCERCRLGCHALNGSCLTAECVKGFYGNDCNETCGHCVNTSCDYYTGNCQAGCKKNWSGKKCDIKKCLDGYYGDTCLLKCGACKNVTCEITGVCTNGCEDGFLGDNCTQVCPDGYYGANCSMKCGACKNVTCGTNGTCTEGCIDGFIGDNCTEVCPDGYYGANCSMKCGACKNVTCGDNGTCTEGCIEGFLGDNCTEALVEKVTKRVGTRIGAGVLAAGVFIAFLLFVVFEYRNRKGMIAKPGRGASETEIRTLSLKSRSTHFRGPILPEELLEGGENGEQGLRGGEQGLVGGEQGLRGGEQGLKGGEQGLKGGEQGLKRGEQGLKGGEQVLWGGEQGWLEGVQRYLKGDEGYLEGDENFEREAEKGKEGEAEQGKKGEVGDIVDGEESVDPEPKGLKRTAVQGGEH